MMVKTARFGEIEVPQASIIAFPKGILAFNQEKQFALLAINETPFFKWLQSLASPELTFLVVDPFTIKQDYQLELDNNTKETLTIKQRQDVVIYTIVTVPPTGLINATTNLLAPLVINYQSKLAKQIVLNGDYQDLRHPLYHGQAPKETKGEQQC